LRGESGTGKELVARAIHQASPRSNKPFVAVDCATLPETLVESELFGYERGAFTGAQNNKLGKFEMAHEGTIFLDEIGNLNPQSQIKLLRVLQERAIDRLGGKKLVKVDVRVVAATNINLEKALRDGHFREDLYHRLNVFSLVLPPLREREGDIIYLSKHFFDKYNKEFSKSIRSIAQGTLKLLNAYHWPGNVRELENVIKSAIILADEELQPRHLPPAMQQKVSSSESGLKHSLRNVARDASHKAEQAMIQQALKESNWNKKKASRLLGVDYKTLYNKMKAYGINFSPNGV
jgi:transcriptional regulator with PAS, ATPase and Fis domain